MKWYSCLFILNINFFADLFCIRLEGWNWSLFTLWSTSGAVSKQTRRDCSRVRVYFSLGKFIFCAKSSKNCGKTREKQQPWHLSRMINLIFTTMCLFYLQLILRTWVPWLSAPDVLCAVTRLSRALSARIEMSVSLAYAAAIHQALLTKRTVLRRWTKVRLCVCESSPWEDLFIMSIMLKIACAEFES